LSVIVAAHPPLLLRLAPFFLDFSSRAKIQ
jgi:hypothetical protein